MVEDVSLGKAEKYYKVEKPAIDNVVRAKLKGADLIVYGARAVNAYLPKYLDKPTEDWDILAKENPQKIAGVIEKALDQRYGGDYFYVEPARHEGTFRIKSKVTKRAVADVTMIDEQVPHERKFGINFATLDFQVKEIKKILNDPESKYRWDKDRETLQRINIHRKSLTGSSPRVSPKMPKLR